MMIEALDPTDNTLRVKWNIQVNTSDIERVKNASDLVKAFVFLDIWTDDERVSTITYTSIIEAFSFTETFTYSWVSGSYLIANITNSINT